MTVKRSKEEVTGAIDGCMAARCLIRSQASVLAVNPKMCSFQCGFPPYLSL
jgi:hypothetical protein